MIIVICSHCHKQMWDGLSQEEIADRSQEAIDILCSDCMLKIQRSIKAMVY